MDSPPDSEFEVRGEELLQPRNGVRVPGGSGQQGCLASKLKGALLSTGLMGDRIGITVQELFSAELREPSLCPQTTPSSPPPADGHSVSCLLFYSSPSPTQGAVGQPIGAADQATSSPQLLPKSGAPGGSHRGEHHLGFCFLPVCMPAV